jgi:chromosome segregation ATPase
VRNQFLFIFFFSLLINTQVGAEIKVYQDTDNTGTSKFERIGIIEKYLINLSETLKSMEEKVEANSQKLKKLEENISTLKEKDLKLLTSRIDEVALVKKKESKESEEIEKLKSDIVTMKNDDIEKMKTDLQALRSSLKQFEKEKGL